MTSIGYKNQFAYVLKSIRKNPALKPILPNLENKNYLISGGTRGIGYSIADHLVGLGANVMVIGKTSTPHSKLENTIYSAAEQINKKHNSTNCLSACVDIRSPLSIDNALVHAEETFGQLDGVVLNASALCLDNTLGQKEKEIRLMSEVNIMGTFIMGQKCIRHIENSKHGSVLLIAPPIEMLYDDNWWTNHLYYSMSKFNMSLMSKFWDKEFPGIGVNTLWPRTTVDTAPVRNILGGEEMSNISRTPDIMGKAASHIFLADPKKCSGFHFIDDEVLASLDEDVEQYRVNPHISEKELMPDFFC